MKKFDNAITQIIFVEYPEGVEVMHLTKVYKNGCLVDYELIYADGTSDEFCKKWGNDFVDCENLSPITIKSDYFEEFKNELKGAIKMRKIYFTCRHQFFKGNYKNIAIECVDDGKQLNKIIENAHKTNKEYGYKVYSYIGYTYKKPTNREIYTLKEFKALDF